MMVLPHLVQSAMPSGNTAIPMSNCLLCEACDVDLIAPAVANNKHYSTLVQATDMKCNPE